MHEPKPIEHSIFMGQVADNGYQIQTPAGTTSYLLEKPGSTKYKTYEPLVENPALFAEFAELEPTKEAITDFANKYGLLIGKGYPVVKGSKSNFSTAVTPGDPVLIWFNEIAHMKALMTIWRHYLEQNKEALAQWFYWENGQIKCVPLTKTYPGDNSPYAWHDFSQSVNNLLAIPKVAAQIIPGDILLPVKIFVMTVVNDKLVQYPALAQITINVNGLILAPKFQPKNLLSVLWFQFSRYVIGELKVTPCIVCGGWVEFTDGKKMKAHPACSNRWRVKKSRIRPDVLRLHAEGKTVSEITLALNADRRMVLQILEVANGRFN